MLAGHLGLKISKSPWHGLSAGLGDWISAGEEEEEREGSSGEEVRCRCPQKTDGPDPYRRLARGFVQVVQQCNTADRRLQPVTEGEGHACSQKKGGGSCTGWPDDPDGRAEARTSAGNSPPTGLQIPSLCFDGTGALDTGSRQRGNWLAPQGGRALGRPGQALDGCIWT